MRPSRRILAPLLLAALFVLPAATILNEPARDTIKRSFNVRPGGTIMIDVDMGNVTVEPSGENMVHVVLERIVDTDNEEEAKRILSRHESQIEQEGNDVIVESRYDRDGDGWTRRNLRDAFRLKVTVYIPDEYDVDFRTGAGNVTVSDVVGDVEGVTGAGNIDIGEVTGDIEIRSGSGNIDIDGVDGSLRVTSGAGNVTLGYVTGEVRANTGAGDITARITEQPRRDSHIETGAGNVTVFLAARVGLDVDARASVGSAACEFGLQVKGKWMSKSFGGEVNGGGPALTMRSGVGNVALRRL